MFPSRPISNHDVDRRRDKPLVLIAPANGAMRLAAVNRRASLAGLGSGMSLADARALEPGLDVAELAPAAETRALFALARWAQRYTPWVAPSGFGEAFESGGGAGLWLDVTGCSHLFARRQNSENDTEENDIEEEENDIEEDGEPALLAELILRLQRLGYTARAGLADTPGAAWAVARFAGPRTASQMIVPPGVTATALAALPVAALRLPADMRENLDRLGLRRIEHLMALPRAGLGLRFGPFLARRLDQALGAEAEPISPLAPAPDLTVSTCFAEPLGAPDSVRAAIRDLLEKLAQKLEAHGAGIRRLEVALTRVGGCRDRLRIATSRATRSPDHLMRLIDERLDRLASPRGAEFLLENLIETIEIMVCFSSSLSFSQQEISGVPAAPGASAFDTAVMAGLVDRLFARLGRDAVLRLAPRASHLPECAQGPTPAVAGSKVTDHSHAPLCVTYVARPPRLLSQPEPIVAVAPVPDDPPVLFRWRGRVHHVAFADGPERLVAEWWRPQPALGEATRDYYRVEDRDGARFWLYRAGLYRVDSERAPAWFLHGFFG